MKAGLLAVAVLTAAGIVFHGAGTMNAAKASGHHPAAHPALPSASLSLPLFFEPNQGQTDGRVKFLAHGAGYGLFLTANEAVLDLERSAGKGQPATGSVIRMKLEGASSAARIQGTQPLPGKSNYLIGNDPSKWRSGIPQFASVEYQAVYPGIDLVYYGSQQQLEYDFRVAPGAEPNQIALSFQGASAHLESGDLVLSTARGDVRFRAPRIYQPGNQPGASAEESIPGSFRQLADNKIGFSVGAYDHSRELVIDPVLSYSTFFGGGGEVCPSGLSEPVPGQGCPQVALDTNNFIYLAGSTTSANLPAGSEYPPYQSSLNPAQGAQNIFIAVINPSLAPAQQLLYFTYLGGSGQDSLAGIGVATAIEYGTTGFDIYVAGTTTSTDFPTSSVLTPFQTAPPYPGTHGFVSRLNPAAGSSSSTAELRYSTYLAGTINAGTASGVDTLTGLAIDTSGNAYVTGTTTSTNVNSGFPSTPNAFQICPWEQTGVVCPASGPPQFFASEINTAGSGAQSMLYSTYFGGGYTYGTAVVTGGGIAVDPPNSSSTTVNMYFTGTTNMPEAGLPGSNGAAGFPLYNAWQSCLDESGVTSCTLTGPTNTDAFLAKINPSQSQPGAPPVYSTYLGASGNDTGNAVAVDTSGNAYVTGSTVSPTPPATGWNCVNICILGASPFNTAGPAGATNAFLAKVANEGGQYFPLDFFAYMGTSGTDIGQAVTVDTVGTAHLAGVTSGDLVTLNPILPTVSSSYNGGTFGGGGADAFVALISTTLTTTTTGDYLTYLGGSGLDQGTGIALDLNGAAYVVGTTQSSNFPTVNPLPPGQLTGAQNAFVTKIGANSNIVTSVATGNPTPNPLPAGTQGTFTFNLTNQGPDPASNVLFEATIVSTNGLASLPTATVSSGLGSCTQQPLGETIVCQIGDLAVNGVATVEVFATPESPAFGKNPTVSVTGMASANGGSFGGSTGQSVDVTDFAFQPPPAPPSQTVQNGQLATFTISLQADYPEGYNATITMSETSSPSIVTNPAPAFTVTPVTLSGTTVATTQLNIQTVARPVTTGGLFRRTSFYAAWLPIGGLSLVGLGIGAGRKRRRWFIGAVLGLLAGLILLQPACSSSSSPTITTGGTAAGTYTITITGSASTGASHQTQVTLNVT